MLENLELVLTDFGKQKGTDYTPEDLLRTAQLTDYYPDTTQQSSSSYKAEDPSGYPTYGGATRIVYYYHPDYLGNVEYITDADGLPYQYFWYSPWGENLKEENATTNGWSSPYRFNGKELDRETGLAYYGHRYYSPMTSVWLSVDRLAAKYPNSSPYVFTGNNPVMLIDPNGDSTRYVFGNLLLLETNDGCDDVVEIKKDDFREFMRLAGATPEEIRNKKNWNDAAIYRFTGYDRNNPDSSQDHGVGETFENTAKKIEAFGFGNDIKNELISYAEKSSKLSPGAAKYLRVTKSLGVVGSVVTTAYSSSLVYDQYQTGGVNEVFQHRDVLDASVGVLGLGAGTLAAFGLISNPVGWAIGAGVLIYGGATLICDAYNER